MRNLQLSLIAALGLLAACGPSPREVTVAVLDHETRRGIDSVRIELQGQWGPDGQRETLQTYTTNAEGRVRFIYEPEEGRQYWVEAERHHYQRLVSDNGVEYLNEAELPRRDTATVRLELELITGPDPDRLAKVQQAVPVGELLGKLRSGNWDYTMLPAIGWDDIPALLQAASDTAWVKRYPHHPRSNYRPREARVGLVALWLIEAIRQHELKGPEDLQLLVAPSRAPFLGTSQGNPTGFNSVEQLQQAHAAYQQWYDAVQAADSSARERAIRSIPLQGQGLSWM